MVSKYDGTCAHCEQAILPGDNIVYVYQDKAVMCAACGMEVDAGER
jgi:ribosomal protein L24E